MAYRSSAIASSGSGGTITATPAGVQAHDYLCSIYSKDGIGATQNLPAGWTQRVDLSAAAPDNQDAWVADKGDASGSDAFGFSDSNGAKENAVITVALSGRNNSAPRTAIGTATIDTATNASPVSASINGVTAVDGDDILVWQTTDQTADVARWTYSQITNYTEREDGVNVNWTSGINLQTRDAVSAGATGSLTCTITGTTGTTGYRGVTMAIAAATGAAAAYGIRSFAFKNPGRGPLRAARFKPFAQGIAPSAAAASDIQADGAISITGSADLDGTGTLAGAGALSISGSADLDARGTLAAAGALSITGSADLREAKDISAAGTLSITGSADLDGTGTVAAAGALSITGAADLDARGALTAAGALSINGAADLDARGTLAAAGALSINGSALLADADSADLLAAGALSITGAADLDGTGKLQAAGVLSIAGAADLDARGVLSADGTLVIAGAATIRAIGQLSAAAQIAIFGAALLVDANAIVGPPPKGRRADASPLDRKTTARTARSMKAEPSRRRL